MLKPNEIECFSADVLADEAELVAEAGGHAGCEHDQSRADGRIVGEDDLWALRIRFDIDRLSDDELHRARKLGAHDVDEVLVEIP